VSLLVVSLNSCIDRTLLAPGFAVGAHCVAELEAETPAGKGVNVARILAQLGVPVRLLALVGDDRIDRFRSLLGSPGLEAECLPACSRTRVNTTILDPGSGTETHVREKGEPVRVEALAALGERLARAAAGEWVVFSGSLPPGLAVEDFSARITDLAARGVRVAVDTSGPALAAAFAAGAVLLKPNRIELADLAGPNPEASLPATATRLAAARPGCRLLISDGAEGAFWIGPGERWKGKAAEPLELRKTVGAGDALLAGALAGLHRGLPAEGCLRLALQTAGASLSCPAAGEIDALRLPRLPVILTPAED